MKPARVLAAAMLLASCGAQDQDLKRELDLRSRDLRGAIEPLPAMRLAPGVRYEARALPDPFYPERP